MWCGEASISLFEAEYLVKVFGGPLAGIGLAGVSLPYISGFTRTMDGCESLHVFCAMEHL